MDFSYNIPCQKYLSFLVSFNSSSFSSRRLIRIFIRSNFNFLWEKSNCKHFELFSISSFEVIFRCFLQIKQFLFVLFSLENFIHKYILIISFCHYPYLQPFQVSSISALSNLHLLLLLFFTQAQLVCLYAHKCRDNHWSMSNLTMGISLKKTDPPHCSKQLPVAPQPGLGSWELFPTSWLEWWLVWSCAGLVQATKAFESTGHSIPVIPRRDCSQQCLPGSFCSLSTPSSTMFWALRGGVCYRCPISIWALHNHYFMYFDLL